MRLKQMLVASAVMLFVSVSEATADDCMIDVGLQYSPPFPRLSDLNLLSMPRNLVAREIFDAQYSGLTADYLGLAASETACAKGMDDSASDGSSDVEYYCSRLVFNDRNRFGYIEYSPRQALAPNTSHYFLINIDAGYDEGNLDGGHFFSTCATEVSPAFLADAPVIMTGDYLDVVPPSTPVLRSASALCDSLDNCRLGTYLSLALTESTDSDTPRQLMRYLVYAQVDGASLDFYSFAVEQNRDEAAGITHYISYNSCLDGYCSCDELRDQTVKVAVQAVDAGGNLSPLSEPVESSIEIREDTSDCSHSSSCLDGGPMMFVFFAGWPLARWRRLRNRRDGRRTT